MGQLTTHVLDTANGCPAAGVRIRVNRIEGDHAQQIADTASNADGRCDGPLLAGKAFTVGQYEIIFATGAYFTQKGMLLDAPPFLDEIVIRFGIAHADQHYHVPLLVSPYGYSTYRGS